MNKQEKRGRYTTGMPHVNTKLRNKPMMMMMMMMNAVVILYAMLVEGSNLPAASGIHFQRHYFVTVIHGGP